MLKKLAIFAKAYIYADRQGNIHVAKADNVTQSAPVQITPDNAFSYNLPDFSKTVINRVNVEYTEVVSGEDKDNEFEIDLNKCGSTEDGLHYIVELKLKNFYKAVSKGMIKRYTQSNYLVEEPSFNFEI